MPVSGMSCSTGQSSNRSAKLRSSSRAGAAIVMRRDRISRSATCHRLPKCSCRPSLSALLAGYPRSLAHTASSVLGEINTDRGSLHVDHPPQGAHFPTSTLGTFEAGSGRRPPHQIRVAGWVRFTLLMTDAWRFAAQSGIAIRSSSVSTMNVTRSLAGSVLLAF